MDDISGSYTDSAEPEFDAPPVFAEQDERRMHVRAYNYWASLLRGREFPAPGEIKPEEIEDFGPNSVILDFSGNRDNPVLRFVGDRLRAECELDGQDIGFEAVPARSLLSRLTDHYFEIIANRAPIGFEAEFTSRRGNNTMYRGILMPLSDDGRTIDHIYGVINWKELADADIEASLQLEAGLIENAPPADELEARMFGDPLPGQVAPEMDEAEPEPQPLDADAGLADRLARARETAETAKSVADRSRAALYRALGEAYDFHLSAEVKPDEYAELLEDSGLKVQARSPMTPVAKLVFGMDYDKARLTEFAAALGYARRQRTEPGGFEGLIGATEGGLKGLVKAERAARRAEAQKPAVDRAAARRSRLRAAEAQAQVEMDAPGEDEFVLVIARREAGGSLALMGAVPEPGALLDKALRKLG